MKENFLHFVSATPSTLNINGEYVGNIDNINSGEIDIICKTTNMFVTYSPVSDIAPAIPYTYLLHTLSTPATPNQYVKVVPFPNNHYDIIMKPFYYYQISEPNVLYNGSIGKYFVSIVCDNITRITILSGGNIVFATNAPQISSVKVEESKGLIIIEGIISSENYYLLIIDTSDFSILQSDIVQSINNDGSNISSFKDIGTICHHAQVCTVNLGSRQVDKYYVYKENSSQYISPPLLPLALLECVKVGDDKKCESLLGNNLQGSTTSDLLQFFGNFEEAYLNRHNFEHKLNYTIDGKKMKNYYFLIENNKVVDIEENF